MTDYDDLQERHGMAMIRRLRMAAAALGLAVALGPTLMRGYFAYDHTREVLQQEAQGLAAEIVLAGQPPLRPAPQLDTARLGERLREAVLRGEAEAARLLDARGHELARSEGWSEHFVIEASVPLPWAGQKDLALALQSSLSPVLANVVVVGALSIAVGLAIYLALARLAAGSLATTLRQLGRARRDAEAATRARSTFLATMSHEIRTPMNGVVGMASLLAETELDARQKRWVGVIRSSAASLVTIINDILDFSRIESGQLPLDKQPFSPRDLAEEVLTLFALPAADKGLELLCRVDDSTPEWVAADVTRVRQVLTNLVGNAMKFTESGAIVVSIDAPATDRLRFEVRDSGIGMDATQLAAVFSPFVQADASTARRYGGTGLGLAISERLVALMGGQISARSTPGQGSTFRFDIAVQPAHPPPDWMRDRDPSMLRGQVVLFVDDNPDNLEILQAHARLWGMQPHLVASGAAALEAVEQHPKIGLAVLDFRMPGMDGVTLAEALKARRPELPIVLLSSGAGAADAVASHRHLFAALLDKPVRRIDLMDALLGIVHGHALLPALRDGALPAPPPDTRRAVAPQVLLVEDNEVNALVFRALLERVDLTADWVDSGEAALQALQREAYDLVFMDVQLPGEDGLATTRRIRAASLTRQPYIAALTANVMADNRRACLAAGMDGFLSKPISLQDLREFLRTFLDARGAR